MNRTLTLHGRSRPLTTAQKRLRREIRHLTLWTIQAWLAMAYIAAGYAKVSESLAVLEGLLSWMRPALEPAARALGFLEIGLGLCMLVPLLSWTLGRPAVRIGAVAMAISSTAMIVVSGVERDLWSVLLNIILVGLSAIVFLGRSRHPDQV